MLLPDAVVRGNVYCPTVRDEDDSHVEDEGGRSC